MVDLYVLLLGLFIVAFAFVMAFAKSPFTSAFALVGLMVCLGGIYGFIGAHFAAAIQLIVYAGAIMVLFVFAIMLLNMNEEHLELRANKGRALGSGVALLALAAIFISAFKQFELFPGKPAVGKFSLEYIKELGGNVEVLSGLLFSKYFFQFEVITLVLMVAIMAALVLAKRKVD